MTDVTNLIPVMKPITKEEAEDIREKFDQLQTNFNEIVEFLRMRMEHHEFDRFKYNCLGHCEPALFEEHQWAVMRGSITTLESVVQDVEDEAGAEPDEDDEEGDEHGD